MRAVRLSSEMIRVLDLPEPDPGPGQVLVNVERAGICGSDLHMIAEGFSGVTLGHEFAGRLEDGTRVAVRPTGACGECDECRSGRTNLCALAFGAFHGGLIDGGWAERVAVHASTVFPVPHSISAGGATLVEPLAVAVHGFRRIAVTEGLRVGIIGGGSVGLAAAAVGLHFGLDVAVDARYGHQQDAAGNLGATVGLRDTFDVVVDAVGTQSAVSAALGACRSGGTILELGVFWEPVTVSRELTLREISLVPALFYAHDHSRSDFETAIDVVATRPEIESIMVTHVFALDDAAEAVRVAGDRSEGAIKVHLAVAP